MEMTYSEYMMRLKLGTLPVCEVGKPPQEIMLTNAPTPTLFRGVNGFVEVMKCVQKSRSQP